MQLTTRILLLCFYYILVVSQHENFGRFLAENISKPIGRSAYNNVSIGITICCLIIISFIVYQRLKSLNSDFQKIVITYLSATFLLLIMAWNTIFVLNVEFIHIFQYGLLAFLLYPLINHFTGVLFYTTLFGALDELNQYLILTPDNAYYDLNDVIINFFGAVIGALSFIVLNYNNLKVWNKGVKRFTIFFSIFLFAIILIGFITNLLVVGPEMHASSLFRFYREEIIHFWHKIPPDVSFHVVTPFEFLCYMLLLFVFYHKLGSLIR